MSSSRPPLSARPAFLPDEISRREFATVFRGYDPAEVRTFLNQLSEQSAELSDRVAAIQKALAETEERVKNPELDEEMVTKLLGEQTAQILRSAREAANDTRARAEAEVSKSLREAHEVTTKMREEAEALLAERSEEAERVAAQVRAEAAEWSEGVRADAQQWADRTRASAEEETLAMRTGAETEAANIRAEVADEIEQARAAAEAENAQQLSATRNEAREIIELARSEAEALVERTQARQGELIEGLIRKRKIALAQVEELRAGRQRLLKAYKMVRGTLDEVTAELERVEDEARQSAELAGLRAAQQAEIPQEELDTVVELQQFELNDDVSDEVINLIENQTPTPAGDPSSADNRDVADDADVAYIDADEGSGGENGDTGSGGFYDGQAEDTPNEGGRQSERGAVATMSHLGTNLGFETQEQEVMPLDVEVLEDDELEMLDAEPPRRSTLSSFIIGEATVVGPEGAVDKNLEMRREAALNKSRSQATRRLKRALQDEQDALTTRLRNGDGASVQALLGSAEDQAAAYHRAVVRLFREVVRTGASSVEGSQGVERGVIDRTGTTAARGMANELVNDLRSQLEPVLEELLAGDEMPEAHTLNDLIGAPYRVMKGEYLDQLADDRLGGAFDQGVAFAQ